MKDLRSSTDPEQEKGQYRDIQKQLYLNQLALIVTIKRDMMTSAEQPTTPLILPARISRPISPLVLDEEKEDKD